MTFFPQISQQKLSRSRKSAFLREKISRLMKSEGKNFRQLVSRPVIDSTLYFAFHRPFSYSENECVSNDISLQFVEFSNVHNCDRSSKATLSNLVYKIV